MLFDVTYHFNPEDLLTDSDREMIELWRLRRASGGQGGGLGGAMGGGAPAMLEPGGLLDQSAAMVEAFAIMDGAVAALDAEDRESDRRAKGAR